MQHFFRTGPCQRAISSPTHGRPHPFTQIPGVFLFVHFCSAIFIQMRQCLTHEKETFSSSTKISLTSQIKTSSFSFGWRPAPSLVSHSTYSLLFRPPQIQAAMQLFIYFFIINAPCFWGQKYTFPTRIPSHSYSSIQGPRTLQATAMWSASDPFRRDCSCSWGTNVPVFLFTLQVPFSPWGLENTRAKDLRLLVSSLCRRHCAINTNMRIGTEMTLDLGVEGPATIAVPFYEVFCWKINLIRS